MPPLPSTIRQVLVPFGADFRFRNASFQFANFDALRAAIAKGASRYRTRWNANVTISYSTFSEYVAAVQRSGAAFPTMHGSPFMPFYMVRRAHAA